MIGQRIQRYRRDRRMSLSELAERAGVAKSYLSAIERQIQNNPSVHVVEKLAAVLGVSVQTLLLEEPDAESPELDADWVELARQAMESGISKEQFREFMEYQRWRLKQSTE